MAEPYSVDAHDHALLTRLDNTGAYEIKFCVISIKKEEAASWKAKLQQGNSPWLTAIT